MESRTLCFGNGFILSEQPQLVLRPNSPKVCCRYKDAWEARPPLPPDQKREAVAFMNSNCQPASDRTRIVEELREQPGITVDALGRCLNEGNVTPAGAGNKQETFRKLAPLPTTSLH